MTNTTTRETFRVNGVRCEGYDELRKRIDWPVGVLGNERTVYSPQWWGNAIPLTEHGHANYTVTARAAPGSHGLPAPLRPRYEADDDPEADAELEALYRARYWEDRNTPLREWDAIFGWVRMAGVWMHKGWLPAGPGDIERLGITTRELRAQLPFRGATGVECSDCFGAGERHYPGQCNRCQSGLGEAAGDCERRPCPACSGTGRIAPERAAVRDPGVCGKCGGTGDGDDEYPRYCTRCGGSGRWDGRGRPGEDHGSGRCPVCYAVVTRVEELGEGEWGWRTVAGSLGPYRRTVADELARRDPDRVWLLDQNSQST